MRSCLLCNRVDFADWMTILLIAISGRDEIDTSSYNDNSPWEMVKERAAEAMALADSHQRSHYESGILILLHAQTPRHRAINQLYSHIDGE